MRVPVWQVHAVQRKSRMKLGFMVVFVTAMLIALFLSVTHKVPLKNTATATLPRDVLLYLWLVFGNWQSYATGGGVTALLIVYERLVKPLSIREFRFIVLGGFILAATFNAWHDAYLSMKGRERDLRIANLQIEAYKIRSLQPQISFSPQIVIPPTTDSGKSEQHFRQIEKALADNQRSEELTKKQLASRAFSLALSLRQLQSESDISDKNIINAYDAGAFGEKFSDKAFKGMMAAEDHNRDQRDMKYRTKMEGEATYLVRGMLSRLPTQPPSQISISVETGNLSGSEPLNQIADYLETLARKLVP